MSTITMITSAKACAGKTALTSLLGESLAASGSKTLIVELDNSPGCMDLFTSAAGSVIYNTDDVVNGSCEIAQAVAHSSLNSKLDVIYSSHSQSSCPLHELTDDILSLVSQYDHVIIDTASQLDLISAVAAISMHCIVVSCVDPISLRDARVLVEQLNSENAHDIRVIFNRFTTSNFTSGVLKSLDEAIDLVGARLIGALPESPNIFKALMKGKPLPSKCEIAKELTAISKRISGEEVPSVITTL